MRYRAGGKWASRFGVSGFVRWDVEVSVVCSLGAPFLSELVGSDTCNRRTGRLCGRPAPMDAVVCRSVTPVTCRVKPGSISSGTVVVLVYERQRKATLLAFAAKLLGTLYAFPPASTGAGYLTIPMLVIRPSLPWSEGCSL